VIQKKLALITKLFKFEMSDDKNAFAVNHNGDEERVDTALIIENNERKIALIHEYRKINYSIDRIRELLDSGADVNAIDFDGDLYQRHTILYEACMRRDEDMVELLLSRNADPNIYYNEPVRFRKNEGHRSTKVRKSMTKNS
jgi:ankyrin repeat protein